MAKNNEKYAYLNRLSTEQLEELLRADMEASKPGNDEAVFHILEVIEQRENQQPTGRIPDVEEAWKEFQREYDLPEGEGMSLYPCVPEGEENSAPPVRRRRSAVTHQPRLHRRVKQSLAALTAVVALVCGMAAAQAAGFDVLGMLGQWTDEIFHFTSGPESGESAAPMNENTRLLREALASVGIDEDLAPTWFPEGFTAEEPAIETSNFNIVIYFSLTDGTDNFINIAIRQYQSAEDLESADYEIKTDSVQQYSNEKQTFYLFSNGNAVAATWANGLLMEQITGNIDEAEIKHIIDSIGGDIN